jgi:hypothetical protein
VFTFNKNPIPEKFDSADINVEAIIKVLKHAYLIKKDIIVYKDLNRNIKKLDETKQALQDIMDYGLLEGSTWKIEVGNRSKIPFITKSLPKNKLSKLDICWQNIIIPFGM